MLEINAKVLKEEEGSFTTPLVVFLRLLVISVLVAALTHQLSNKSSFNSVVSDSSRNDLIASAPSVQLMMLYHESSVPIDPYSFLEARTQTALVLQQANTIHPTQDYQWVGITLTNTAKRVRNLYLHVDYPGLGSVQFYTLSEGGPELLKSWGTAKTIHAGYSRTAAILLDFKPGEVKQLFTLVHTNERGHYSFQATERDSFLENLTFTSLSYSLFLGLHISMFLFGTGFILNVRLMKLPFDVKYAAYFCGYLVLGACFMTNFDGSLSHIIPQNSLAYGLRISLSMIALSLYLFFTMAFLDIDDKYPSNWLKKAFRITNIANLVIIPFTLILDNWILFYLGVTLFLVNTTLVTTASIFRHFEGCINAKFLAAAWIFKLLACYKVPFWLFDLYEVDLSIFQYNLRLVWVSEFIVLALAICLKLKIDFEQRLNARVLEQEKITEHERIDQVICGVIHDLKGPLCNIRDTSEILVRDTFASAPQRRFELLRDISRSALHQILLGFDRARAQQGGEGGIIYVADFNPVDLMSQIKSSFERQREERGVDIIYNLSPALANCSMRGDITRIHYIIENAILEPLLQSDVKYITIDIDISRSNDSEVQYLRFALEDNSLHMFAMNTQNQQSPLENALEHLEAMGGYDVSSDNNNRRVLYIPVEIETISLHRNNSKKLSVLVVDDQRDLWATLTESFADDPIITTYRETIHDAKSIIINNTFDIIVVDGHLPDGIGDELVKSIRTFGKNKQSHIICYSGEEDRSFQTLFLDAGANQFIDKSLGVAQLRYCILKAGQSS